MNELPDSSSRLHGDTVFISLDFCPELASQIFWSTHIRKHRSTKVGKYCSSYPGLCHLRQRGAGNCQRSGRQSHRAMAMYLYPLIDRPTEWLNILIPPIYAYKSITTEHIFFYLCILLFCLSCFIVEAGHILPCIGIHRLYSPPSLVYLTNIWWYITTSLSMPHLLHISFVMTPALSRINTTLS